MVLSTFYDVGRSASLKDGSLRELLRGVLDAPHSPGNVADLLNALAADIERKYGTRIERVFSPKQ